MTMFHLSAVQKHIKERHKAVCPFPDYPDEKATVVAAFALVAGFNVYNFQKSDMMSELALANVEALANDVESGDDFTNGTDCVAVWEDYTCRGKDGKLYSNSIHKANS